MERKPSDNQFKSRIIIVCSSPVEGNGAMKLPAVNAVIINNLSFKNSITYSDFIMNPDIYHCFELSFVSSGLFSMLDSSLRQSTREEVSCSRMLFNGECYLLSNFIAIID